MEEPIDDFESETDDFESNEPSVAVAQNPSFNGTGVGPRQGVARTPSGEVINKKVTESYTVPVNTGQIANHLMGRVNSRPPFAPEKARAKEDRDFLDEFNIKADAAKYQLSCIRNLPAANSDGDPVPTGIASKHIFPVMSYDELVDSIQGVWGGGSYRVSFVEENGRLADNIARCIIVNIPTTQCAPKREKFEVVEASRVSKSTSPAVTPMSESALLEIEAQNEFKLRELEARRREKLDELAQRETEREYKKLKREKELQQLRKELLEPGELKKSSEIELLERRLEEEKRAREAAEMRREQERKEERERQERRDEEARRRDEETRKLMMDGIMRMSESIREVANKPVQKDDSIEKLMAMVVPIATALVNRPIPPPPDNTPLLLEMSKQQMTSQQASMQTIATIMARPADNSNEKMLETIIKVGSKQDATNQAMITGMMQALLEKDKGQVLTPEVIMDLQERAEKRMERMMGLNSGIRGQDGEEGGDDGYDPALGFLGNAGKALFGSLKALMDSAATNPALMNLAAQLIGSRNPTDRQLIQVAQRLEQSGGIPPAIGYQQQPMLPEVSSYAQPQIPYPQPPQNQLRAGSGMPPPLAQPAQQPQFAQGPVNPMPVQAPQAITGAQQQSVASELEGATSGLPSNDGPDLSSQLTPDQLAEENLIDAVSRTVEIMIAEMKGKPAKRTWPEDASDHWNKGFVDHVCSLITSNDQLRAIGMKCDPSVRNVFNQTLRENPDELSILWTELARFVSMNQKAAPAPVQSVDQPNSPPSIQQTPGNPS